MIYSFSKYWGATGLRLGVVGLHEANALDARIAAMRIGGTADQIGAYVLQADPLTVYLSDVIAGKN